MRTVRCVDRIHKIHEMETETTRWVYVVRGETYEETNDLKTRQFGSMSDAAKSKAKQKWAIEKPKLDNARKQSQEVRNSDASGNALPDTSKQR